MNSFRIRLLPTLLMLLLPAVAMAQRLDFPAAHCSITIPNGWTREPEAETSNPLIIMAASGDERTKVAILVVDKVPDGFDLHDPSTKKQLEEETKKHASIISSGATKLAGLDGYRILAREKIGGTSLSVITVANGSMYLLRANVKSGDAGKDADISQLIASFSVTSSGPAGSAMIPGGTPSAGDRIFFDSALCSVVLPASGWVRLPDEKNPKGLLALIRNDGVLVITLMTPQFPSPLNIRSRTAVDSIESSMKRIGIEGQGQFVKLGGIDAYAVTGKPKNSTERYFYSISTIANGRFYVLAMIGKGSDPTKDPDVKAFLDNFAFIGTPKVAPK